MPIRYRCQHCGQLQSIATRMAGQWVTCPICAQETRVPHEDELSQTSSERPVDVAADQPVECTEEDSPAEIRATAGEGGDSPSVPGATTVSHSARESHSAQAESPRRSSPGDEGEFRLRRPRTEFDDMDLTPMVDVTFLLLIFFMITASFSLQKTIEFPAPNPEQQGASQSLSLEDLEESTVFVRIDERNGIFIDDVPVPNRDVLIEKLQAARLTTLRSETAIDAHVEALHETVVTVIDAATSAGMQRIRLVSRSRDP